MTRENFPAVVVVGLVLFASARPAAAHNLMAEAKLKGDRVEVEAFFDDNTPAIGAQVTVTDESGTTVAEGKTDAQGRWSFPRPAAGKYRVIAYAGAGHRDQVSLEIPATTSSEVSTLETQNGPAREDLVRPHWGRVALGLAAIAALAVAWVFGRRWLRS